MSQGSLHRGLGRRHAAGAHQHRMTTHPAPLAEPSVPADRTIGSAAVARMWFRLTRRESVLLAVAMAAYMGIEAFAFESAYPDAASKAKMTAIADNAAVRMLQGIPRAIETTGGYVIWDAGWTITSIVGVWAVLMTTRLLRGEEESDRIALVLAVPVSACRTVRIQMLVLAAACLATGTALAGALLAARTEVGGSVLFGLGIAGFGATFVGLAAVLAQVFSTRRRALAAASALLAGAFVLRMIANSTPGRGGLAWATPYGWVDQLRPYDLDRWWALAPLLLTPLALGATALRLRARRDTGGSLLAGEGRREARLRFLGGPTAFAWRLNVSVLAGWLTGIAAYAFVIGSVASAVTDLTAADPDYRRLLEKMGMELALTDRGFVSMMSSTVGLMLALYVCWRIAAARAEEAAGLAEQILTRPVRRGRWLRGHAALAVAGAVLAACAGGAATWLGALAGGADVTLLDGLAAALGTLPAVVVFGGIALLVFGLAPRLTTVVSVGCAVLAYLLELLGPALSLPAWALGLSPFHHLAYVPAEPFAVGPAAALGGIALLLALTGGVLFARRDVASA